MTEMTLQQLEASYGVAWGEGCPVCAQQPKERCANWNGSADPSQWTYLDEPHAERVAQANWRISVECGEGDTAPCVASPKVIDAVAGELV